METVIVRSRSHRSTAKLLRLVGHAVQSYGSWTVRTTAGEAWYEIPARLLEEAVKIKGITKSRMPASPIKHW